MIVSLISKFSVKHQIVPNYFYIIKIYVRYDNRCYYTLHIFPLYESNKVIWMLYEEFADEGNNPMENPNIHNVEGDTMLSSGLQLLTEVY